MNADRHEPKFDEHVPHPARWYNYWLGGKENFAADRQFGATVAFQFPGILHTARENRRFLGRLVTHLARDHGIRQFLDIGTGLPTADNTHEVAQRVDPTTRIVYVDNDPLVMCHARALLTSTPEGQTAYAEADLREPDKILGSTEVANALDLARPTALLLVAVLHFIPDDADPFSIVRRLTSALPSNSFLAITHGTFDGMSQDTAAALDDLSKSGKYPFHSRTRQQVSRFFDGLELLDPGLVNVVDWRCGDEPKPTCPAEEVAGYGGLARIP